MISDLPPNEARESIALLLRDALRNTDPMIARLEPNAFEVVASGLKLLMEDGAITHDDEERLCRELLESGWYLVPPADQLPPAEFR